MATITIKRDESGAVVFDPSTIKLGGGDYAIWVNEDPRAAHQPTLQGQAKDYWMNYELPSFVEGEAAASSPAINLTGAAGSSITYVDGLDASVAPGTITF
jgi:plastocyanin